MSRKQNAEGFSSGVCVCVSSVIIIRKKGVKSLSPRTVLSVIRVDK